MRAHCLGPEGSKGITQTSKRKQNKCHCRAVESVLTPCMGKCVIGTRPITTLSLRIRLAPVISVTGKNTISFVKQKKKNK